MTGRPARRRWAGWRLRPECVLLIGATHARVHPRPAVVERPGVEVVGLCRVHVQVGGVGARHELQLGQCIGTLGPNPGVEVGPQGAVGAVELGPIRVPLRSVGAGADRVVRTPNVPVPACHHRSPACPAPTLRNGTRIGPSRPHPPRPVEPTSTPGFGPGCRCIARAGVHAAAPTPPTVRVPAEPTTSTPGPLDDRWTRMDSSVRGTDEEYALPAEVANRPNASGWSTCHWVARGADVELMQRLVDCSYHRTASSSAKVRKPIESTWRTTWSELRCFRRPR